MQQVELPTAKQMKSMIENGIAVASDTLANAARAVVTEDLKIASKIILAALYQVQEEGVEVAEDVLAALEKMRDEAVPIAKDIAHKVGDWFKSNLIDKIPDEVVTTLQKAVGTAAKAGAEALKIVWDALQEAIDLAKQAGRELAKIDWDQVGYIFGQAFDEAGNLILC